MFFKSALEGCSPRGTKYSEFVRDAGNLDFCVNSSVFTFFCCSLKLLCYSLTFPGKPRFSKVSTHQNHLVDLLKYTLPGPTPQISDSEALRICTSNRLLKDDGAAGPGLTP